MNESVMLKVAESDDNPELTEILVATFDSSILRWVLRDDDRHLEALYTLLRYTLNESIPYDGTIVTKELDAYVVWTLPGIWSKSPRALFK